MADTFNPEDHLLRPADVSKVIEQMQSSSGSETPYSEELKKKLVEQHQRSLSQTSVPLEKGTPFVQRGEGPSGNPKYTLFGEIGNSPSVGTPRVGSQEDSPTIEGGPTTKSEIGDVEYSDARSEPDTAHQGEGSYHGDAGLASGFDDHGPRYVTHQEMNELTEALNEFILATITEHLKPISARLQTLGADVTASGGVLDGVQARLSSLITRVENLTALPRKHVVDSKEGYRPPVPSVSGPEQNGKGKGKENNSQTVEEGIIKSFLQENSTYPTLLMVRNAKLRKVQGLLNLPVKPTSVGEHSWNTEGLLQALL